MRRSRRSVRRSRRCCRRSGAWPAGAGDSAWRGDVIGGYALVHRAGSGEMVGQQAPKASRRGTAQRPTGGRRIWPLLAAVVLLALVAAGSLRSAPGSGAGTPRFPSALLQTLGLLALVTVLAGLAVAAWTMLPGKNQLVRPRRNPLFVPLMLMGFVLLLALLRRLGWLDRLGFPGLRPAPSPTSPAGPAASPGGRLTGGDPGWIPFVVVGVLLAGLAAAIVLRSEQARRRRAALDGPGRQLAELLQGTLADLEDEPDPRRAVIAAWIRMEGGLAAAGLPRHAAEAPLEYVARVLEQANVQPAHPPARVSELDVVLDHRPARPPPPAELESLGRMLGLASASGVYVHNRLRPELRAIARELLFARLGIDLDAEPEAARVAVGPAVWDLIRPDREGPDGYESPGLPPPVLARIVADLEGVSQR